MIGAGVTLYEALKAADQLAAQVTGVKDLLLLLKILNFFLSPFYFY